MFDFTTVKKGPTIFNDPIKFPGKSEPFASKVDKYAKATVHIIGAAKAINKACHHRRTDKEIDSDSSGLDKSAEEYQYCKQIPLSEAVNIAERTSGVYILYLNGRVMKCGRASYSQGISWRFRQYYNLNYDDRSRNGDCWSVSKENRDKITVSWQCCPPSKCHELEYKLFQKYGKGEWAQRAPDYCATDSWKLLI